MKRLLAILLALPMVVSAADGISFPEFMAGLGKTCGPMDDGKASRSGEWQKIGRCKNPEGALQIFGSKPGVVSRAQLMLVSEFGERRQFIDGLLLGGVFLSTFGIKTPKQIEWYSNAVDQTAVNAKKGTGPQWAAAKTDKYTVEVRMMGMMGFYTISVEPVAKNPPKY